MSERWLLGSTSATSEGVWRSILEMKAVSQTLFLERVLFLHRIASARSSSSTTVLRLSLPQWEKEADLSCLGSYVLEAMYEEKDVEKANTSVFDDSCMKMVTTRFIEG